MVDGDLAFRFGMLVTVVFLAMTGISFYAMIAIGYDFEAWLWLVTAGTILGLLLVGLSVLGATVKKVAVGQITSNP